MAPSWSKDANGNWTTSLGHCSVKLVRRSLQWCWILVSDGISVRGGSSAAFMDAKANAIATLIEYQRRRTGHGMAA